MLVISIHVDMMISIFFTERGKTSINQSTVLVLFLIILCLIYPSPSFPEGKWFLKTISKEFKSVENKRKAETGWWMDR